MNSLAAVVLIALSLVCSPVSGGFAASPDRVEKTEEEWKALLTPEQFAVARKKRMSVLCRVYWDHHEKGIYGCVCCGAEKLFSSADKFDSGSDGEFHEDG